MKVTFLKSGVNPSDYPSPDKPEVALVGRSNAGKSSFINALTGQKIARVGSTPGMTRLLNFFQLDESMYLVDTPGYGFARGNQNEVESWKQMIETYLNERETLKGVFLIMDIRREWSDEEEMLKDWFAANDVPWAVVLNKADKLSRSQAASQRKVITAEMQSAPPVFSVSSSKNEGFEDVRDLVFDEWGR
jgi:GTP-binding protein